MKIKMVYLALLISFVLIGCQNNKLNLEGITHIEVYNWQSKELLKTIDDASFIENLVTNLNKANGEEISDTADIAILPYEIVFKNKEQTIMELGFDQIENKSHFMDYENSIRYTLDITLPNIPLATTSPMTKEEIEEGNKKEKELEKQYQEAQKDKN
ncbi:hypothetical protein RJD24_10880 [Bacillaceae bacterium IKA-2]|nr:hypothetical protein RJD24_10880 [Bacillaceae bacterium IKA-2]